MQPSSWGHLRARRFMWLVTQLVVVLLHGPVGGYDEVIGPGCRTVDLPTFSFSEFFYEIIGHAAVYQCKQGSSRLPGKPNTTYCIRGSWTPLEDPCEGTSCAVPPDVLDGSHNGNETYPYGIVIKYHCMESFTLIGSPSIYCDVDDNNGKALWRGKPPKCKAAICPNPVVQDGIKLSGFRDSYTYGNSITYECKIGYFIIGSYFIRCEENSAWVPKVPSCKKISPDVCGAPIIPEGTLYPLQPEYKIGNVIAVYCNPNYSFLDETTKMNVQCQGYNQWDPPVPPCFFRTSPDTSELYIHHGRIVLGEKRRYNPGDEVTIECYPGYTLKGSSKINYVGGKKWLPNIPVCSLSFFFRMLIAVLKSMPYITYTEIVSV